MSFYEADVSFSHLGGKYTEKRKIIPLEEVCDALKLTAISTLHSYVTYKSIPGYYLDEKGNIYSSRVSHDPKRVRALYSSNGSNGTTPTHFNLTDKYGVNIKVPQTALVSLIDAYLTKSGFKREETEVSTSELKQNERAYYIREYEFDDAVQGFIDTVSDCEINSSDLAQVTMDNEKVIRVILNARTGEYRVEDVTVEIVKKVKHVARTRKD